MYRVPAFLVFQPFHLANRVLHVGLPLFQLHMLMGKLAFVKHSTMDSRRRILHGRSTHLLIMLMLIASIVGVSSTSDTLLSTQSVRDGQTLVSRSQTFELGFFSPDNSGNRYVGIWYKNIAEQTVVWVANRQSPVIDRTGVLTFDSGSLLIIDSRGSSFQVASGFAAASVAATIQDTGNLVLKDVNDSSPVLWQSFDYPTDTFLPGMKVGRAGKRNRLLTSWTTADDPSPGDYSLGIDPNGTSQFFIWQNDHIYWSSGAWNGIRFSGVPEMTSNYIFNFTFTSTMNDEYFTYFLKDDSIISRLVVDVSGQIQQLTWLDRAQKWVLFWAQPKPQCDVYNLCGDFGVCNEDNLQHCQCLTGFEPGSQADWNNGATNGGCTRKADLQCVTRGKQDGFLPLDHMKFPVSPQILDDSNDGECQSACLGNCSCTAYAFNGTCQLWFGNLKNLQQLNDNVKDKAGTLYLRLAASEFRGTESKKLKICSTLAIPHDDIGNKRHLQIIVSVTVITGMLLMILLVCTCWMIRRRGKKNENPELPLLALGTHLARKLGEDESAGEFAIFSFSQVACATDNFSMENKLGEGGFGPVYKGRLPEGQEIAVKRLSTRSGQGLKEFKNEILLIAKLQHRNLVRLLGFCIQGEEKILIYEYMPNKSLDFFLFDPTKRAQLEWGMCFHIIEGIAQGLLYLHKHSRMRIIHRDLKASNILLDGEMNPKISDFGMARIFSSNEIQANTNRIVGTYGYMSPEYASEGLFSIKSDVFSFGVLLLEILTGKRNAGFHQYGNSLNLLGYAWELWNKGMWLELMDPSLGGACPGADLSNCLHVALLCVQESAVDRPTMSDVITMLSSEGANLPEPKHPAFFTLRRGTEAELSSNTPKNCSVNDVTVTDIEGR